MNKFKLMGWLSVGGLLGAALLAPSAALATQPAPDHKVTICHRTDSNTNPYNENTVDIASSGHLQGGHDTEHEGPIWDPSLKSQKIEWGDIIPPYTYGDFSYAGQNWTAEGQTILRAGCVVETSEPSQDVETQRAVRRVETSEPSQDVETASPPDASPSRRRTSRPASRRRTPRPSEPSQDTETSEPSQDVETSTPCADCTPASHSVPTPTPCADCVPSTHSVPSGSVDGATGTPDEGVTPPATDTLTPSNTTASNDGWQLVLIALAALISTALILTPATRKARR